MTRARQPAGKRPAPKAARAPKTAPPAFDIVIEAGDWPAARTLKGYVAWALEAACRSVKPPAGAELAVTFTDDAHIRVLNRQFRRKDKPTNVLSFPAGPAGSVLLGDIVLAAETVSREADEQGISRRDHVIHLIVHGFLHLLGHDHEVEAEALVMERLETAILAAIGIADPYADW
jgi:probable rRNA maturation factor